MVPEAPDASLFIVVVTDRADTPPLSGALALMGLPSMCIDLIDACNFSFSVSSECAFAGFSLACSARCCP